MAKFDIFANPNPRASHAFYVDVQSDFVQLSTRWCIPLYKNVTPLNLQRGVQAPIVIHQHSFVLDTPNMLAVPVSVLRTKVGHLQPNERLLAEGCIEFVLRGY